ncbi:MAG: polysaccharide pyruvyl transferase family protein [Burkholderiales bacterium]|nr:polysaccharide pyruvyl transferase family protein [Burkholderiales bacterium]
MTPAASLGIPTILFGACDRHNFGDLLFPHIAAAMLAPARLHYAGLARRDLRGYGGHSVCALAQLAASRGARPLNLIHVGGELLTCDAWQAAVMLLAPQQAQAIAVRFDGQPPARQAWAHAQLGSAARAPYCAPSLPAAQVFYNAVGGVALDLCEAGLRAEVVAKLKAATDVSVRERHTQALLDAAGVASRLLPDPAVMVAELFGGRIEHRARHGELARLLAACPQGYLALQFSSDFGDDRSLTNIAAQLDQFARASGLAVVFFRAGAAPWHDDLQCYRRTAARMRASAVHIFQSLNLWDICALLAHSRAYCGSSLHGRIVATAYAKPRLNIQTAEQAMRVSKQSAYAATWEAPGAPAVVTVQDLAEGMRLAMAADGAQSRHTAAELTRLYRQGFAPLRAAVERA